MAGARSYPTNRLERYLDGLGSLGTEIDRTRFKAGLQYAKLSASFYILWLLHLKLKADPGGSLPSWMHHLAREYLAGGLLHQARDASEALNHAA